MKTSIFAFWCAPNCNALPDHGLKKNGGRMRNKNRFYLKILNFNFSYFDRIIHSIIILMNLMFFTAYVCTLWLLLHSVRSLLLLVFATPTLSLTDFSWSVDLSVFEDNVICKLVKTIIYKITFVTHRYIPLRFSIFDRFHSVLMRFNPGHFDGDEE